MIKFVNAKINIGLNIVSRRPDGYHNLETVFYPIGVESGTPQSPSPFCDILECVATGGSDSFEQTGREVMCAPDQNLVWRALNLFRGKLNDKGLSEDTMPSGISFTLDKHIPDGAGLGGGSADATFTLVMLNEMSGNLFDEHELADMALRLGADCPFFLLNSPAFASGVGDLLLPIRLPLEGMWCVVTKPEVYVSTAEAFAGINPKPSEFDLRLLPELPVDEWQGVVCNDFEETVFRLYPILEELKLEHIGRGAVYASMSGSGSSIYGIYRDATQARKAADHFRSTLKGVWLLKL